MIYGSNGAFEFQHCKLYEVTILEDGKEITFLCLAQGIEDVNSPSGNIIRINVRSENVYITKTATIENKLNIDRMIIPSSNQ
jgi:hypothetical protein